MNLDWTKIINGYRGFESLAVKFVKEHEQQKGYSWTKTKDTQDKNHDAIMAKESPEKKTPDVAIFVGYSDSVDVWWMEAKYSAIEADKNKIITRYRLDATIVSAILSKNISKVIFVTNLNISSKTISDIRKALIFSGSCKEVAFYIKNHLEYWILKKTYSWFRMHFDYSEAEYSKLTFPMYNCIEELALYNIGDNLFQEPLNTIYTDFLYEIHFSFFVQKNYHAKLVSSTNVKLLSDDSNSLMIKPGINEYKFNVKIPRELKYEPIHKKDVAGEYKDILPINLIYELEDCDNHQKNNIEIIPASALKIVNSDYFYLDILSQKNLCKELLGETEDNFYDPVRKFTLISLYGKSGVGKTYVIQLYKSKLAESNSIICCSYAFSGDKIDDAKVIKKFIFNLFFPFISYEDLDDEYLTQLQKNYRYLPCGYWDFISPSNELGSFIKFHTNLNLLYQVLPDRISINDRVVIFDDIHKLAQEYQEILEQIIKIFIKYEYPLFCVLVSQNKIDLEKFRLNKHQHLLSKKLIIDYNDIEEIFKNKLKDIEINNPSILFGSVIEIVYFIKYIASLNGEIKNLDEFKLAYTLYKDSEILKNEIISKFKTVFNKNEEAENLCSCIYYTPSGIHMDKIYTSEKSKKLISLLLDAELIKKDENDFFVGWHDYYKEIYIKNFPLKMYKEINLPFKNIYDIKIQFNLEYTNSEMVEYVLKCLDNLYSQQKFYDIYYILENIFSDKEKRVQYKNRICNQEYCLLFAFFCYANTNAGTVYPGYEMFNQLYYESLRSSDIVVQTIHYIILWELINSLYEGDKYIPCIEKINIFDRMPVNIQKNWKTLFGWDYPSIKYAVGTIKMFIDSENGINCLDKVPSEKSLSDKDVAFSTYRLLLCNLTNDFLNSSILLRKYNNIVQTSNNYERKTKYMYNFAVKFLDCIDNKINISEVISANGLLKKEYFNDYNRHIFAVAILALLKSDISLCETYRMEYIKTNRPMKPRQKAFEALYSALVNIVNSKKQSALKELNKAKEYFGGKPTYLSVISHNINYINTQTFCLEHVTFFLGGRLLPDQYYIDIRMLY